MQTTTFIGFLVVSSALQGCIWGYSHAQPTAPLSPATEPGPSSFYAGKGSYMFGGRDGVREAIHERYPSAEELEEYDPPTKGVHVRVRPRDVEMPLTGKVYGYVSVFAFDALIPFYNGSMGYDVLYEVFRDGAKVKTYRYEVRRKLFVWLPAIPFMIADVFTTSESGALQDTTEKFFEDAEREHAFSIALSSR